MLIEIVLIGLIIVLPLIAQSKITSAYNKYSEVQNSRNMSGKEVARKILDRNGLSNITIGEIAGNLTDHYNPSKKHINLSEGIYNGKSISAASVAAHECGHAIQDKESYSFLRFRTALVPVVNFTSRIASVLLIVGFAAELLKIVYVGIALLCVGLLFQFITLPVEFDASRRGKKQLQELGLVDKKDITGTEKVLKAAALTYVAGFLSTALQILRLVLVSRNRD